MKYLELKEYHDGLLLGDLEKLDQNNNKCTKMLTLDELVKVYAEILRYS